ncbi:MAG: DUF1697 domain-containing protein [Acidimicrobiia bacterium]
MSPGKRQAPTRHVALLRGINLGARHKVAMPALRALFESLGHEDVETYIQSGNVAFRAAPGSGAGLATDLEAAITKEFGFPVPVVVRAAKDLEKVMAANPFLAGGADPSALHVVFLGSAPAPGALARLDPDRSPGDGFAAAGAEVYLHCPNGFGRSKLGLDWFERILKTPATIRNWRTVTRMAELSRASSVTP